MAMFGGACLLFVMARLMIDFDVFKDWDPNERVFSFIVAACIGILVLGDVLAKLPTQSGRAVGEFQRARILTKHAITDEEAAKMTREQFIQLEIMENSQMVVDGSWFFEME